MARGRPKSLPFLLLGAIGMALILIGWIIASGDTHFGDQIPALNVGITGTVVVLVTCAGYLKRYRRVVRGRAALLCREPAGRSSG